MLTTIRMMIPMLINMREIKRIFSLRCVKELNDDGQHIFGHQDDSVWTLLSKSGSQTVITEKFKLSESNKHSDSILISIFIFSNHESIHRSTMCRWLSLMPQQGLLQLSQSGSWDEGTMSKTLGQTLNLGFC